MNIIRVAQGPVASARLSLHQNATRTQHRQTVQPSTLQPKHSQFVRRPAIRPLSMSSPLRSSESSDAQMITLRSGHTIGYATYGSPLGTPVLFFHGVPSSRIEPKVIDHIAKKVNARIISVDRPGMGLSSFQPHRHILDWPSDIAELTNQLGLKDFRVCGGSGGGPYALACARGIPTEGDPSVLQPPKVTAVISGAGPWSMGTKGMPLLYRLVLNIAAWSPAFFGWIMYRMIGKAANSSDTAAIKKKWRAQAKYISKRDAAALTQEATLDALASISREAFRQGSRGRY